jgi:hypothetical protein
VGCSYCGRVVMSHPGVDPSRLEAMLRAYRAPASLFDAFKAAEDPNRSGIPQPLLPPPPSALRGRDKGSLAQPPGKSEGPRPGDDGPILAWA